MEFVCDFKDYYGSIEDLICIIDTANNRVIWPKDENAEINLQALMNNHLLVVYVHREPPRITYAEEDQE